MTSCVAVLAKNSCVCGCQQGLYYSKVNIYSFERFIRTGIVIVDTFLLQPHHFFIKLITMVEVN